MSNVPRFFGSSVDPNKIALTFKGTAIFLIPVIIYLAARFNVQLQESALVGLIEVLTVLVATGVTAYGLVRKVVVWFKENFIKY